ncbi:MAG: DUF58 domain-containing protein [Bacteroidia bacterium]|nr:DUF58 domain-containing protein [Bacteroidia bacterium]
MKRVVQHIKSIYIHPTTFWVFGVVVVGLVLGALASWIFALAVIAAVAFAIILVADYGLLYFRGGFIQATRSMADRLSMGSDNVIKTTVINGYSRPVQIRLIDELPYQLQIRNFSILEDLKVGEEKVLSYTIRPETRGLYTFGDLNFFVTTKALGLIQRRIVIKQQEEVPVYPSLIHMKEIELKSLSKISVNQGVKKMRRLGHSYEFEQIKTYVQGDDYRSINWKATGRNQALMINQYEDEKSQPIYFAIDKGRNMRMPFNGLSLVDYAVNSTLAISNVALQKSDRVGLLTFDKEFDAFIKAENKRGQLSLILEQLYSLVQTDVDPNMNALYHAAKRYVRQRSLIFLFTNCNTLHSLERMRPILNLLNKQHLLVTILFENSEISDLAAKRPSSLEEIYENTIAEKFIYEQQLIASELNSLGIHTIVSKPEELSINTINKYLELKAQGKI